MAQLGCCKFTITIEWSDGNEDKFYLTTLACLWQQSESTLLPKRNLVRAKQISSFIFVSSCLSSVMKNYQPLSLGVYILLFFLFSLSVILIRCLLPSLILSSMFLNFSFIFFISFLSLCNILDSYTHLFNKHLLSTY